MPAQTAIEAAGLNSAADGLPRIAFVGPIAEPGKPAGGGFGAANRRTIDLLRLHGLEVLEVAYPIVGGSVLRKSVSYILQFMQITVALILNRKHWDILHITPLLRQFITAESIICLVARILRRPLFLDFRAGSLISNYEKRGKRYQRRFESLVTGAAVVAIEGSRYADFLRRWYSGTIFYFPNYVVWRQEFHAIERPAPRECGRVRLVTLGRITPDKGVHLAIELVEILQTSGSQPELEVIGTGEPSYVERLRAQCGSLPVSFVGALPPHDIINNLATKHFFIFPTTHSGEGHSNALTEAMALGVVPICFDSGFNSDVVGEAGVILPRTASAQDYSDTILTTYASDEDWRTASRQAQRRVSVKFSHEVVIPRLIQQYKDVNKA